MKPLQSIIDRYKDLIPTTSMGVIGYLAWGARSFYSINSSTPTCLNMRGGGHFILNEKGQVQTFHIDRPSEEFPYGFEKEWGLSLDQYYPWPWYPDAVIIGFEVVRPLPFGVVGVPYRLEPQTNDGDIDTQLIRLIGNEDYGQIPIYTGRQCLDYPEFFKPLYKAATVPNETT